MLSQATCPSKAIKEPLNEMHPVDAESLRKPHEPLIML